MTQLLSVPEEATSNTVANLVKRGRAILTRIEMIQAPVALATHSYTPVTNQSIIETALEEFDKIGFVVKKENYMTESSMQKFVGSFVLRSEDADMDMMFGFKNSYNKQMSAGVALGANVMVCTNGMFTGEDVLTRKHTGTADSDIINGIKEGVKRIHENFVNISDLMKRMKEIEMDKQDMARMVGEIYCNNDFVSTRQLETIKIELFEKETYDYGVKESLYNLYQAITHALKTTPPLSYLRNHVKAHKFLSDKI